jgi:hypothetical protein
VDGKQRKSNAECLKMQETDRPVAGNGKQSEQHEQATTAQKTTQSNNVTSQQVTEVLTEIPMRQPTEKSFSKSLPGTKALIAQQIKTKYVLGTKGLSEEQLVNACAKAYAEVWQQMGIVANQQYGIQIRIEFSTKVYEKACRIVEAKRRRCARTNRQPRSKVEI